MEQAALFDRIDKGNRWNELPNSRYNSQAVDDYHSPLDPASAQVVNHELNLAFEPKIG